MLPLDETGTHERLRDCGPGPLMLSRRTLREHAIRASGSRKLGPFVYTLRDDRLRVGYVPSPVSRDTLLPRDCAYHNRASSSVA